METYDDVKRLFINTWLFTHREDDRVSHYIINRVVSADGTTRYRIGDQLFTDMPALLAFYRLHYLDTTPLVRPLPHSAANVSQPPNQPHQVLEIVTAKFDFHGSGVSVIYVHSS